MRPLRGIYPPIPTPFSASLTSPVDHRALASNIDRWVRTRLAGIVVLGSTGEAVCLDDAESDAVVDTARRAVPHDRVLIVGTGRESTAATIAATRRAAQAGADFALVRTPSFFKSAMTSDAFAHHYSSVADSSPIPILLYNVTIFTGVNLLPEAVERLTTHSNIAGMKESTSDISQISDLVARVPSSFPILAGSGTGFFAAAEAGVSGGVLALATVLPNECVDLFELVRQKQIAEARAIQERITPLAKLIGAGYGIAGLKCALDQIGYAGGPVRSPLLSISADGEQDIRRELDQLSAAGVMLGGGAKA